MLQRCSRTPLVAFGLLVAISTSASSYESGYPGAQVQPGIALGGTTASAPPPGIYMFNQAFTYQANLVGPGAPKVGGAPTPVNVNSGVVGFIFFAWLEFLGRHI